MKPTHQPDPYQLPAPDDRFDRIDRCDPIDPVDPIDRVLGALSRTQAPRALERRVIERLAQDQTSASRARWDAFIASQLPWRLAALTATLALIVFLVSQTAPRRIVPTGSPIRGNETARSAAGRELPGQLDHAEPHPFPPHVVRLASASTRSRAAEIDPAFLPSLAAPPEAPTPQERRLANVLRSQQPMQIAALRDESDPVAALRHLRNEPALFAGFAPRPADPVAADPSTPSPEPQLAAPGPPAETLPPQP